MLVLTGCQQNNARAIIGHTYGQIVSDTQLLAIYFSPKGSASIQYVDKSNDININTSNFDYNIKGNTVDIFYDNSDFWISGVQGTIFMHLTYSPEEDALYYLSDVIYRLD